MRLNRAEQPLPSLSEREGDYQDIVRRAYLVSLTPALPIGEVLKSIPNEILDAVECRASAAILLAAWID